MWHQLPLDLWEDSQMIMGLYNKSKYMSTETAKEISQNLISSFWQPKLAQKIQNIQDCAHLP